jgi:hypothetical protein
MKFIINRILELHVGWRRALTKLAKSIIIPVYKKGHVKDCEN